MVSPSLKDIKSMEVFVIQNWTQTKRCSWSYFLWVCLRRWWPAVVPGYQNHPFYKPMQTCSQQHSGRSGRSVDLSLCHFGVFGDWMWRGGISISCVMDCPVLWCHGQGVAPLDVLLTIKVTYGLTNCSFFPELLCLLLLTALPSHRHPSHGAENNRGWFASLHGINSNKLGHQS